MRISKGGWVSRLLKQSARERDRAAQELRLYKVALENAYEGLVICDREGRILSLNDTYATLLGVRAADVIGKPVADVIENTRMHIVAQTGKAEIADLQLVKGRWMIATRIPIRDQAGNVIAVAGKVVFQDLDNLFQMNTRFKEIRKQLHHPADKEKSAASAKYGMSHIIGDGEPMRSVKAMAVKAAKTNGAVLITGESGTGKELFAHAIHRESSRYSGPFITVNCAAVPEPLFESELFGYKEGAFTGAVKSGKKGKFALAHKGTLFLDEIGDMPLQLQAKLLRVLQEKEIEPVGAAYPEPVDVRIVAATNQNLARLVEQGKFRRDLYYRLHVIELRLPPLRERKEDIPVLAEFILKKLARDNGLHTVQADAAAIRRLQSCDWPGNVRELSNVLERALLFMEGSVIREEDLGLPPFAHGADGAPATGRSESEEGGIRAAAIQEKDGDPGRIVSAQGVTSGAAPDNTEASPAYREQEPLKEQVRRLEKELIAGALRLENGDSQAAARRLGMGKSSFYKKRGEYGL
jgi:PAS domain S-box-containing protein